MRYFAFFRFNTAIFRFKIFFNFLGDKWWASLEFSVTITLNLFPGVYDSLYVNVNFMLPEN